MMTRATIIGDSWSWTDNKAFTNDIWFDKRIEIMYYRLREGDLL